jgi:hypothetical protein
MDLDTLQRKLLAAARANPPDDRVPYAFEKRIVSLASSRPPADFRHELARGLWRAAASCVGIMVLLCAWSLFEPFGFDSSAANELSPDLESTVLAAAGHEDASSVW